MLFDKVTVVLFFIEQGVNVISHYMSNKSNVVRNKARTVESGFAISQVHEMTVVFSFTDQLR